MNVATLRPVKHSSKIATITKIIDNIFIVFDFENDVSTSLIPPVILRTYARIKPTTTIGMDIIRLSPFIFGKRK